MAEVNVKKVDTVFQVTLSEDEMALLTDILGATVDCRDAFDLFNTFADAMESAGVKACRYSFQPVYLE